VGAELLDELTKAHIFKTLQNGKWESKGGFNWINSVVMMQRSEVEQNFSIEQRIRKVASISENGYYFPISLISHSSPREDD
jgi:hypothetical protein